MEKDIERDRMRGRERWGKRQGDWEEKKQRKGEKERKNNYSINKRKIFKRR